MAQTVSITDKGNGKYEIKDSDGQTRNVDFSAASKEASKTGIKITGSSSLPSPNQQTNGYSYIFGQNYPTGSVSNVPAGNVLINGKVTPVADAVTQAQGAKNLGLIRTNLIKYGQLTKAEARDPNNLLNKWATIVAGAANDPDPANRDPFKYAQSLQKQGFVSTYGQTPTTTPQPYTQISVWDPTKAKAEITGLFTSLLNREPTADELSGLQSQLKAAQQKAAAKTTYTKDKSGAITATSTGGLDEQQFLTDLIKATPDYAKVKAAGLESATQKIRDAAKANAIVLSDADLAGYAERVRNGEPVNDIAAQFRKIAAISQPKNIAELLNNGIDLATIYQPYKSAMASVLELNPNTIELTDPALANAITGDKTMTSYEFQNSLRKDPRWQYTANAHDTVSSAVQNVLKDFGFMG